MENISAVCPMKSEGYAAVRCPSLSQVSFLFIEKGVGMAGEGGRRRMTQREKYDKIHI